jgi:hypothetical protein
VWPLVDSFEGMATMTVTSVTTATPDQARLIATMVRQPR